jgi:hypothetical protein
MYIVTTWIGHGWIGGACPGVWCGVLLLLALGFPTFPRKHGIDWGWCGPGGVEEAELEFEWDGRVPRPLVPQAMRLWGKAYLDSSGRRRLV